MSTLETDASRNLEGEREQERYAAQRELDEREPESIEREIDATRADMRATLEALERRWSMDRLIDLTVGRIRERGGEFAGNLTDAVTQNPVPLLLTSIGLGWMMLTNRRATTRSGAGTGALRERTSAFRERASAAGDKVHGAMASARETLHHAAESSRDTAESLRDSAGRAAAATRERIAEARYRAGEVRERMDRMLDEQPLMIGAIGLAAGAIIGALLPATEHESRWIGDAREKAVETVARKTRASYEAARGNSAAYSAPPGGTGEGDGREQSRPH